jgi:hypothetical protein
MRQVQQEILSGHDSRGARQQESEVPEVQEHACKAGILELLYGHIEKIVTSNGRDGMSEAPPPRVEGLDVGIIGEF